MVMEPRRHVDPWDPDYYSPRIYRDVARVLKPGDRWLSERPIYSERQYEPAHETIARLGLGTNTRLISVDDFKYC